MCIDVYTSRYDMCVYIHSNSNVIRYLAVYIYIHIYIYIWPLRFPCPWRLNSTCVSDRFWIMLFERMKELKRQICCFRDWFGFVFIHLFTFNCIWYYLIAYNLSKISCMLLSMQKIAHDRPCALWIGQTLMVWFRNFARKGTVERDCEMVGLHCALENHLVALAHIYQITHETIHHHTFFFESVSLLEDRNSSMWSFWVLWTHGKWMQYDQLVDLSPKVVNPGPFSFLISE